MPLELKNKLMKENGNIKHAETLVKSSLLLSTPCDTKYEY